MLWVFWMKISVSLRRVKGKPRLFMAVFVKSIFSWSSVAFRVRSSDRIEKKPRSRLFKIEEMMRVLKQMIV